jgi:hypothetical protein
VNTEAMTGVDDWLNSQTMVSKPTSFSAFKTSDPPLLGGRVPARPAAHAIT